MVVTLVVAVVVVVGGILVICCVLFSVDIRRGLLLSRQGERGRLFRFVAAVAGCVAVVVVVTIVVVSRRRCADLIVGRVAGVVRCV